MAPPDSNCYNESEPCHSGWKKGCCTGYTCVGEGYKSAGTCMQLHDGSPPDVGVLRASCAKEYNKCWKEMTDTAESSGDNCAFCIDKTISCSDSEKQQIKSNGCCNKLFPRDGMKSNQVCPTTNNLIPQKIKNWRLTTSDKCVAPNPNSGEPPIKTYQTFDKAKFFCDNNLDKCKCITNYDIEGDGETGWFTSPVAFAVAAPDMPGSVAYLNTYHS